MNVLLFVTSLLTILALLTYAKIDSFRYFLGIEAEFERYMQTIEQDYTNTKAEDWYSKTRTKENSGGGGKKAEGSPRLSFLVFIDSDLRSKNSELYQNTMQWAKSLMTTLYGNRQFFKEATQKSSLFIEEILEGLGRAVEQLPDQKKKLKNAADLMNLNLDPQIETPLYLMLKGCQRDKADEANMPVKQNNFVTNPNEIDPDDEEDNLQEAQEYTADAGYDSLLNYITLQNKPKIRVYLASLPLLQAITGQESFARGIIEARTSLYQSIKNISPLPDEISTQFQSMVQGYLGNANTTYLDFTITKTNPTQYN